MSSLKQKEWFWCPDAAVRLAHKLFEPFILYKFKVMYSIRVKRRGDEIFPIPHALLQIFLQN